MDSLRRKCAVHGVNCAAIPADLLESEVVLSREGCVLGGRSASERAARRRCVVLDESANMPGRIANKVLRSSKSGVSPRGGRRAYLQCGVILRTGAILDELFGRAISRDCYVSGSTPWTVDVPPLRSRPEDILWLLARYFDSFLERTDGSLRGVSSLTEAGGVERHPWRGNAPRTPQSRGASRCLGFWPMVDAGDCFRKLRAASTDLADEGLCLQRVRTRPKSANQNSSLTENSGTGVGGRTSPRHFENDTMGKDAAFRNSVEFLIVSGRRALVRLLG